MSAGGSVDGPRPDVDICLSFAAADRRLSSKLVAALRAAGVDVFYEGHLDKTLAASGLSRRELEQVIEEELSQRLVHPHGAEQSLRMPTTGSPRCERRLAGNHQSAFADYLAAQVDRVDSEWVDLPRLWKADVADRGSELLTLIEAQFLAAVADPRFALSQLMERLIKLGRRAHAARQSAAQRVLLARLALKNSPDRPPGDVVMSSARVPRGPDLPRVAPALMVQATRGTQLALT